MKVLPLRKMMEVYVLLKDILPTHAGGSMLDYVEEVIHITLDKRKFTNLKSVLTDLTGISGDTLDNMSGDDAVELLVDTFQEIQLPQFQAVVRRLYDRR